MVGEHPSLKGYSGSRGYFAVHNDPWEAVAA